MEDNTSPKPSRRRRKASPKKASSSDAFQQRMNDLQFEVVDAPLEVVVTEVESTPIVDPAPQPTPIPAEEKLLKPWEIVRPSKPNDGQTWQRGQKWRS